MTDPSGALLEMRGVSKAFGGVRALSDVDLFVGAHSIHAIVGENGAGKSTLMRIVAGAIAPDAGHLAVEGRPTVIDSPHAATALGIQTVYQEPAYYPQLSVLENFHTGAELMRGLGIDWRRERLAAVAALETVGLPADLVDQPMGRLPIGIQQLVLIARAVSRRPRILILDEPTSMLSKAEADILFDLARSLQASGSAVLYISHRIQEVFALTDEITVLRDGRVVGRMQTGEATEEALIELMSGRSIERGLYRAASPGPPLLEVHGLTRAGAYRDVTFDLHEGEILGVYGLVGAGRTEVARAIFGAEPADEGDIRLAGQPIQPRSPAEAIRLGIAYLPEDRRSQGLFLIRSVAENLTTAILRTLVGALARIRPDLERTVAQRLIESLRIRTPSERVPVGDLSGGSQQKVLFGRWLLASPRVLILDEPTRGIDVGTKAEIHRLVVDLARAGTTTVMVISSELAEILAISDRVMVMRAGAVRAILARAEATERRVLRLTLGLQDEARG